MRNFFIEMITPERMFFRGDIEMVIVDTVDGMMGVEAGHIPMVTALRSGVVRFLQKDKWFELSNSEGFLEVRPDETILLAQTLEWPHEIEENKVRQDLARAEEIIRQNKSMREYQLGKASIAKALARLKVKSHYK